MTKHGGGSSGVGVDGAGAFRGLASTQPAYLTRTRRRLGSHWGHAPQPPWPPPRLAESGARQAGGAGQDLNLGHISTPPGGAIGKPWCQNDTMALTLRLSPELQAAAAAHADQVGVSLNALVCVALADYVKLRSTSPLVASAVPAPALAPAPRPPGAYRAPKRRTDPCPCGAHRDGRPVKWKQCHGKPQT